MTKSSNTYTLVGLSGKSSSWDVPALSGLSFVQKLGDVNDNLKRCPPFPSRTRQTN